ncbi:NACHT, LRR and PYD domains-containing protein 12-like [Engraulis encrasicolus]|uniref:NACHT, LRR and PYD domains-containing protein 12-like n=1 Tax=Engraulis encrasicolus TaxID=184585 RepID=UPI002FD79C0F
MKGASGQNEQQNLTHVFQVIETKIIAFVKNELQRFKMILSPDYQEDLKRKDEDESDAREGALKMALHFLLEMERTDLFDKLKEHELEVLCRAELRKHLKNKYKNVSEGIPMQGNSALLEKIYTEVYITEGGSGKINEEHEVRQIESISKRPVGRENQIKCNDIFKPLRGQDKPSRRVMTKGVAGIGKTISIQKYILDWAEGKDNKEIHFIFPLPFRELNLMRGTPLSLMGLLHHFFPELKQLTSDSQEKYKSLFIFDGLDECRLQLNFQENESWTDATGVTSLDVLLTNLIKGNLLPSALLWITSRPAAASQIPPNCVDLVTEIQGFNDTQKEEYFRNRFNDESFASITSHIKSSRSLYIMCHIPVFCWIAAYVLVEIIGSSGRRHLPKTLTEMYTYFLLFQTKHANQKFGKVHDRNLILALGKLAYKQLEKGNLIFYEDDLRECGIDVREAAVYSGVCTQIFRQESAISQETVFCFVHLSIQEYLAALYVFLRMATERKNVISNHQRYQRWTQLFKKQSIPILHKNAVDKALEYEDGRFDLFLRFLLGLSLESNQTLLHGLLQSGERHIGNAETISYIKEKIKDVPSSERVINLFHCLNELKDHSLVEEIQSFLRAGTLCEAQLSPGQWSALVFVLLTSDQKLDVFDLKKYVRSDEGLRRLKPVVEESEMLLLDSCELSEMSCTTMASVLCKASKVKKLNLSYNKIGDVGVKHLCSGLENSNCELKSLRELDLRGNNPGKSGVRLLLELQQDSAFKLQKLRLLKSDAAEHACVFLTSILHENPLLLSELDLKGKIPGDSGVKQFCPLLEDSHCRIKTLKLDSCGLSNTSCTTMASVLCKASKVKKLDLSQNSVGDIGVKALCSGLKNSSCALKSLRLADCGVTGVGYAALASALKSNPSHLEELDLRGNDPGDSGVKLLLELQQDPACKLQTLRLLKSDAAEQACAYLTSMLHENPLLLTQLDLSGKIPGDSGVEQLCALLEDSHCRIKKLKLADCGVTGVGYAALASALKSNPSHLEELDLRGNDPGDSGVKLLLELQQDPACKLQTLRLADCGITGVGYAALASALKSNPSHLEELDLRGNDPGDSGVKLLLELQQDPACKLQTLRLAGCSMTDEGCATLTSALATNPSHLRYLILSENKLGDSGVKQISTLLRNPHCKLQVLDLANCSMTEEGCAALTSALISNPSHLRELYLDVNELGDSGVKQISTLLRNPDCKLQTLRLEDCSITELGCAALTSALISNPSHLTELSLSNNTLGDSGVKQISTLLRIPSCKLQKLG